MNFDDLNEENFVLYAMKHYDNNQCLSEKDFNNEEIKTSFEVNTGLSQLNDELYGDFSAEIMREFRLLDISVSGIISDKLKEDDKNLSEILYTINTTICCC